jgi:hypothetical protein
MLEMLIGRVRLALNDTDRAKGLATVGAIEFEESFAMLEALAILIVTFLEVVNEALIVLKSEALVEVHFEREIVVFFWDEVFITDVGVFSLVMVGIEA